MAGCYNSPCLIKQHIDYFIMVKILWAIRAMLYNLLGVRVGFLSYIGKPLFIHNRGHILIGSRVRIFPSARLETHNKGIIKIANNVAIGQNFHITASSGELCIGEDTTISGNVFVTNIDHDYKEINKHIMDQRMIIRNTKIGRNCFIGYGAAIQAGTILGDQCIVGTNSVVRGIFPDKCVIVGAPARIVRKYNVDSEVWEKV